MYISALKRCSEESSNDSVTGISDTDACTADGLIELCFRSQDVMFSPEIARGGCIYVASPDVLQVTREANIVSLKDPLS